jgi:hypothetical protein
MLNIFKKNEAPKDLQTANNIIKCWYTLNSINMRKNKIIKALEGSEIVVNGEGKCATQLLDVLNNDIEIITDLWLMYTMLGNHKEILDDVLPGHQDIFKELPERTQQLREALAAIFNHPGVREMMELEHKKSIKE